MQNRSWVNHTLCSYGSPSPNYHRPTLAKCRSSVCADGRALNQHRISVWCLLECHREQSVTSDGEFHARLKPSGKPRSIAQPIGCLHPGYEQWRMNMAAALFANWPRWCSLKPLTCSPPPPPPSGPCDPATRPQQSSLKSGTLPLHGSSHLYTIPGELKESISTIKYYYTALKRQTTVTAYFSSEQVTAVCSKSKQH